MARNIDALIFDLDGTLVDSDLYVVMNYVHMYRKYRPGYFPHLREIIGFSGPSVVETVENQFPGEDVDALVREFENYSKRYQSSLLTLYPGEMECVERIWKAGIPMILLTNKKGESARRCMESTGLARYIPAIVSLDDVRQPKPDPEGVEKCLAMLRTDPHRTLIVGDSDTDVLAGARAGIKTGLVTWSLKGLPPAPRDYEFDTFAQIEEFIIDGKYERERRP